MNVLMTTDTVGGVWNHAVELAGALRPRGVRVTLAAMGGPASGAQRAQAAGHGVTVHESGFRLEWMPGSWPDVAAAGDWLLALAREHAADVIHLNGYAHATLPWGVPVLVAAHSCVCTWWRAVHGRAAPAEWDHYRQVVAAGLSAADLVIAPTRALLAAMVREYGPPGRAQVIRNGATPPIAVAAAAREPFVLSAGRLWDPSKNLAALVAAAPLVDWPVRVAGPLEGPDGRAPDSGSLEVLGTLSARDLRALMARAGIYAAPARYEPFGLAILEAAQAGCPLVLGDIATLRELWDGAAVFVPAHAPGALAAALRELSADESRRGELGAAAWARSRRYSTGGMADAYRHAYGRLRAERSAAACA